MAGTDILIASVMKYAGYKPEDLQRAVQFAQTEFQTFRTRAEGSERAIEDLGRRLHSIETLLYRLVSVLSAANPGGGTPAIESDAEAGGDGIQSSGNLN